MPSPVFVPFVELPSYKFLYNYIKLTPFIFYYIISKYILLVLNLYSNMLPRIPRPSKIHCSHCREEGHNISKCDIYNIKLHVSLLTNDESILIPGRNSYCVKLLNPRLFADFK